MDVLAKRSICSNPAAAEAAGCAHCFLATLEKDVTSICLTQALGLGSVSSGEARWSPVCYGQGLGSTAAPRCPSAV